MGRAFLIVIDSVGCGGAPDADRFFNGDLPDSGANTLAHIAQACAAGRADQGRSGPLNVPVMDALGLGAAIRLASGDETPGLAAAPTGAWGAASETSNGKDTPSGHWELAGVPVPWDWHYFPDTKNAFPLNLLEDVAHICGAGGTLFNRHGSGTQVIAQEGARHILTGWPICYTSADSVFQIAAHEEHFGVQRLLDLCQKIAPRLHEQRVGRVIARPFVGDPENGFERTANRRDFALAPPSPTLCDWVQQAGQRVIGVGKIGDIFSMRGIDELYKGADAQLMQHLHDLAHSAPEGSLVFANLVEFDSKFGHRRDVAGYARALEWFDRELGAFLARLGPDDMVLITADHGNDPTWVGTDHTRERVPVLIAGKGAREIGLINFVDVAASVADHLSVPAQGPGRSIL